jgi:hypothetical protein
LSEFGHFYHGETGQPPSEWGLVAMDNELVHYYLIEQGYFQVKYKFIEPILRLLDRFKHKSKVKTTKE